MEGPITEGLTFDDVLLVPGGGGCLNAIENDRFLEEIARLGATAHYLTSVCTGSLILGAAGFLMWIIGRSVQEAPASQNWSLVAVVVLGLILMFAARFGLRSAFFSIPRESDQPLRPGKSSSQNSVTPRPSRGPASWARSSTRRILPEMVLGSSENSMRRMRL